MNATAPSSIGPQPRVLKAIIWGGSACGALDISAAIVVYGFLGAQPLPILKGIAAGVLGPAAMNGGLGTALVGLLLHLVIAFGAATAYVVASRWIPFLLRQTLAAGPLYGIAVYFFMNRVVVPLSRARRPVFSLRMMVIGILIHIFCVGLPIAIAARRALIPADRRPS